MQVVTVKDVQNIFKQSIAERTEQLEKEMAQWKKDTANSTHGFRRGVYGD